MSRPALRAPAHAALPLFSSALALALALTIPFRDASAQARADGTERGPRAPVALDGIAAVVDDARIYRSDVIARSRPFLDRLSKDPVERRAMLADLHKQMLSKMIDELLIEKDAAAARIQVTDAEVSNGIDTIAASNKVDRKQLYAEVKRQGMTQGEYEDAIRHQIVEGKWLMTRAAGRVDRTKATNTGAFEAEMLKHRELLLVELRSRAYIEVR